MTVRELIRAIRTHRGKVAIPVLMPGDVTHIFAEKSDLIACLRQGYKSGENSPWYVVDDTNDILTLDVQEGGTQ